ncbi:hypothetical protein H4219_004174 [Mycoemilia scoparia]|uniref:Methylated-DNA--protein-cysteine methyltransferase n=1 Tax=Mycoemilia scoparia TaxID=417184 RepID=A0A9W8DRT5_9FUNG|nr:hypothetical protein H4219_004174 [Mycoemilia scoparia]
MPRVTRKSMASMKTTTSPYFPKTDVIPSTKTTNAAAIAEMKENVHDGKNSSKNGSVKTTKAKRRNPLDRQFIETNKPEEIDDDIDTVIEYPADPESRKAFINSKTNRQVTEFQFRVYDACAKVPRGHFTTYRTMAAALKSGPRAVGNALRLNPFAPLPVPCHRVVTSDFYVGGFNGDTKSKIFFKKAKLEKEGVCFDDKGYVIDEHRNLKFFEGF